MSLSPGNKLGAYEIISLRGAGGQGEVNKATDTRLFRGTHLLKAVRPQALAHYDVSPDGQGFLMVRRNPGTIPTQINFVINWFEELKRLAPVNSGN